MPPNSAAANATCGSGATCSAAASAPRPAPANPPKENAACSDDRIGRRMRRSIATPWAFIAMSRSPLAMPTSSSESASVGSVGATAGRITARASPATPKAA